MSLLQNQHSTPTQAIIKLLVGQFLLQKGYHTEVFLQLGGPK